MQGDAEATQGDTGATWGDAGAMWGDAELDARVITLASKY